MDTLIFDGKIEKYVEVCGGDTTKLYKVVEPLIKGTGLMRMPCGSCPVAHECHEGGIISPTKCIYMKEWLEL